MYLWSYTLYKGAVRKEREGSGAMKLRSHSCSTPRTLDSQRKSWESPGICTAGPLTSREADKAHTEIVKKKQKQNRASRTKASSPCRGPNRGRRPPGLLLPTQAPNLTEWHPKATPQERGHGPESYQAGTRHCPACLQAPTRDERRQKKEARVLASTHSFSEQQQATLQTRPKEKKVHLGCQTT